jgi:hypothetical protein
LGLVGVQSQRHEKQDRDEKDCDRNEQLRQRRSLLLNKDSRPVFFPHALLGVLRLPDTRTGQHAREIRDSSD